MFKVIKLRYVLLGCTVVLVGVMLSMGIVKASQQTIPRVQYTIVIDAGHGGRDNGCSGDGGSLESVVNLAIAKKLKEYLNAYDINVVMTRSDENGLYDANASNFKVSDMEARVKIIQKAQPNMVVSIHQNAFSDKSQHGAQVFFQKDDEESRAFALAIKDMLVNNLQTPRKEIIAGDYYLLKSSNSPAVIVECGYLSNDQDEKNLMNEKYQEKVAYTIMCGIVKYFSLCE